MKQRTLKFRAWDAKYKKMHYKVSLGNNHDQKNYTAHALYLMPGDTDYYIPESGEWMHFDENSDIHIMQFTGLSDKNGTEIYEGDIVSVPYVTPDGRITDSETHKSQIVFRDGSFKINSSNKSVFYEASRWCEVEKIEYISNYGEHEILSDITELTVIGNIHQNPDLL